MILEQLTRLQRALAERVPANPAADRNVRLANALEADLRRYFRDLELAFPYAEIERLYYSALAEADRDYERDERGRFSSTGAPTSCI